MVSSAGLCRGAGEHVLAHAPGLAAATHTHIDFARGFKVSESSEALLFWDQSVATLS